MKILILITLIAMITPRMEHSTAESNVSLDKEFQLRVGQEVSVRETNLKIKFISVVEDSRCPAGADCIWQGNAGIRLELKKSDKEKVSVTLNTNLPPQETQYHEYTMRLVKLNPYPQSEKTITPDQYEATLIMSEVKKAGKGKLSE